VYEGVIGGGSGEELLGKSIGVRAPVMLREAKHLEGERERPFAAAQGDRVRRLRLMRIGPIKRRWAR